MTTVAAQVGNRSRSIVGCIIGTAIGDALGLACENLSARRQRRLFPSLDGYGLVHGRGMVSDDTEHTCFVAQSIIDADGDVDVFASVLARRLRWWLACIPAGVGFATLRSIIKLWCGWSPKHSGVFSAGNGPAMRSALLGICYGHDKEKLMAFVKASTIVSHSDPKALWGATAVAWAAHLAAQSAGTPVDGQHYLDTFEALVPKETEEFNALLRTVVTSVDKGESTAGCAEQMGLAEGIGGYIYHTVPLAIHCWLRNQGDYRTAVTEIIRCGGDTDTTAAIVGAIVGCQVGIDGIPEYLQAGIWEWPRSLAWMKELGLALGQQMDRADEQSNRVAPADPPLLSVLVRNLVFLSIVLVTALRRGLPPY